MCVVYRGFGGAAYLSAGIKPILVTSSTDYSS
jgi:hypothetical protein